MPPAGVSYETLGFVILYDTEQVATPASGGLGNDFHSVAGPDQWWSWWAYIIFGLALLCCVMPLAACIYHFRPGHSGPPSPTGSGGNSVVMFGRSKHGKDDVEAMGGGNLNAKQFEKAGGGYGEDGVGYNDAATGISVSIYFIYLFIFWGGELLGLYGWELGLGLVGVFFGAGSGLGWGGVDVFFYGCGGGKVWEDVGMWCCNRVVVVFSVVVLVEGNGGRGGGREGAWSCCSELSNWSLAAAVRSHYNGPLLSCCSFICFLVFLFLLAHFACSGHTGTWLISVPQCKYRLNGILICRR